MAVIILSGDPPSRRRQSTGNEPGHANWALKGGIMRDLAGRVGTLQERIFAGLSVPCLILVSAFVHGKEMSEISHFLKIRVP